MTSKAERRRKARERAEARARLGIVSDRGRPPKDGPRHKSGALVQKVEPNAIVIEQRKAIMGDAEADASAAEDPMILAFARGWITDRDLKAGKAFATAYRDTHTPKRVSPSYESPDMGDRDTRSIREMSNAEIVEAFDAMMDGTRRRAMTDTRHASAAARYLAWSSKLSILEHNEVFQAFVREAWPQWLTWQITGRAQTADSMRRRAALMSGLEILRGLLTKKAARPIREMSGV